MERKIKSKFEKLKIRSYSRDLANIEKKTFSVI
jgi:hypothetical protein